jgi:hypothetical protein
VTPEEFIEGLRERGYRPIRYEGPPRTILARIDPDDTLYRWLQDTMGVEMIPYVLSAEVPLTYEAQLHKALVSVPMIENEKAADYVARRAKAVWDAAAP